MEFTTVYKGKQEWTISVTDCNGYSTVTVVYGQTGGKMTTSVAKVDSGKNLGKANATTHYTQALSVARSKREHKIKSGYAAKEVSDEARVNSNPPIPDPVPTRPMLAHDFKKYQKKVLFPCYIQPKLDGYRMIYTHESQLCTTRTGAEYICINGSALKADIVAFAQKLQDTLVANGNTDTKVVLDGELYIHGAPFESHGVLRRKKATDADLVEIKYHVYDVVVPDWTFAERNTFLKHFVPDAALRVQIVQTKTIESLESIEKEHLGYIADGYEGSIIRNTCGLYAIGKRSTDLLKVKTFDDAEFEITGATFEEVSVNGAPPMKLVIWICKTDEPEPSSGIRMTFNVQSTGTKEQRASLYCDRAKYIGHKLNVKFFGVSADGVPRFPKTNRPGLLAIRDSVV